MTNKSLSEQICEICGIEPRYGVYQNFGDLDNDYRLVTNTRKCRLIADTRFHVDDEDLRNLKPIYYPDFEQPENFVKLLEIIHAKMNIEGLLMYELDSDSFVRRFLKLVIKFLNGELGYVETKINAVKQAIREEEWKYE